MKYIANLCTTIYSVDIKQVVPMIKSPLPQIMSLSESAISNNYCFIALFSWSFLSLRH